MLRGGASALRIGKHVRAFEARVAALFGKRRGVMCNSGSSALYLAVELLGLEPGDEVLTAALTFSTDVAPLVRAGLVPVFVDVEPDSYNLDVAQLEAALGPRTRALLAPNLIGNAPDWDAIRALADRTGIRVIEDSCDALGVTLRGTPTGARSDISVTSFALSHIITAAGTGGMVCLDDEALADRCLLLRRWGRRSEPQLFGSRKGDKRFFSVARGARVRQPVHLRRARLELRAVRAGRRLRPGAARQAARLSRAPAVQLRAPLRALRPPSRGVRAAEDAPRPRDRLAHVPGPHPPRVGRAPRDAPGLRSRSAASTAAWCGRGTSLRQPAFRAIRHRVAPGGLAHTDRVMEQGLVLPCHHGMGDDDVDWIGECVEAFLRDRS